MAKEGFLPNDKPGYLQWHDTFKPGVTELGAELGATAGEITAVGIRNTEAKAAIAKQATGEADAVMKAALATDVTRRISGNGGSQRSASLPGTMQLT